MRPEAGRNFEKAVADYETGPDAEVPHDRAASAVATAERFVAHIAMLTETGYGATDPG